MTRYKITFFFSETLNIVIEPSLEEEYERIRAMWDDRGIEMINIHTTRTFTDLTTSIPKANVAFTSFEVTRT